MSKPKLNWDREHKQRLNSRDAVRNKETGWQQPKAWADRAAALRRSCIRCAAASTEENAMSDDIKLTIICMYTCKSCGVTKVPVSVPAREPEQDVVEFAHATADLLGADHGRLSPSCPSRKLDIYLPMSGDTVGGATLQ